MPSNRLSLMFATLSILLIFLAATTIWFFKSHHHTGLDDSLCKCEQFHAGHSGRPIQPRILNGSAFTSPHGLSWLASLVYQASANYTQDLKIYLPKAVPNETEILFLPVCTASILNCRMVLLASHCIKPFSNETDSLFVAAGSDHDLNSIYCPQTREGPNSTKLCNFEAKSNHLRKVKKIHMHPNYTATYFLSRSTDLEYWQKTISNDIALIEVEPFDLSDELNILPGCLFESEAHSLGSNLLAAGYGRTVKGKEKEKEREEGKGRSVEIERRSSGKIFQILNLLGGTQLQTTQFKQLDCEHLWDSIPGNDSTIKKKVLCVTSEFSAACKGDSGGPLHYSEDGTKLFIVGVASSSFLNDSTQKGGRCVPGDIAVYTSVAHHLEWIKSIAGDALCLTSRFRRTPLDWTLYLLGLALFALAATLTAFFIATELRRLQNESK